MTQSYLAFHRSDLKAPLQFDNYRGKFCLLLHLEEIQMEVDIHRYDMHDVSMGAERNLLVLKVSKTQPRACIEMVRVVHICLGLQLLEFPGQHDELWFKNTDIHMGTPCPPPTPYSSR